MKKHTQQGPAPRPTPYQQVLDLQDQLVHRGVLSSRLHQVVEADSYDTVRDTTVIRCTCDEWIDQPTAAAQRAYAEHIVTALRVRLGLAA